jgi:hypothetical protein
MTDPLLFCVFHLGYTALCLWLGYTLGQSIENEGKSPVIVAGLTDAHGRPDVNGIAFNCTVEGMHLTSVEKNIPAWALGCSCPNCCGKPAWMLQRL